MWNRNPVTQKQEFTTCSHFFPPSNTHDYVVKQILVNIAFISANHTYTVKKCICIITLKRYQNCEDSVWLVESGYSVWGHQNDLHVITLMKRHPLGLKCFPVHKVNWNSKLKVMKGGNKQTKKQTEKLQFLQFDGTFQVLKWNFNWCLIQNEAWWQINNWK